MTLILPLIALLLKLLILPLPLKIFEATIDIAIDRKILLLLMSATHMCYFECSPFFREVVGLGPGGLILLNCPFASFFSVIDEITLQGQRKGLKIRAKRGLVLTIHLCFDSLKSS